MSGQAPAPPCFAARLRRSATGAVRDIARGRRRTERCNIRAEPFRRRRPNRRRLLRADVSSRNRLRRSSSVPAFIGNDESAEAVSDILRKCTAFLQQTKNEKRSRKPGRCRHMSGSGKSLSCSFLSRKPIRSGHSVRTAGPARRNDVRAGHESRLPVPPVPFPGLSGVFGAMYRT